MLEVETILQDRYQLKQKLGDNPARQTWLAIDLQLPDNPQVVIKFLAFGGQIQWENLKLFERESQVLKQLNHSHIPKYRDYFCIDERSLWFALVEDYIPGSSLKELLNQNQRFTEIQLTKIAVDILNILDYLHQLNPPVLHRDIKPSNLILGENRQVYLVDFGSVQDSTTKEGGTFTVVGTYGYTPMEQFGGRAVPASDLYALGATLIHLLTGVAPADLPQKDFRINFSNKVSVSPGFRRWIEQLTEPSLERRFNNVRRALDALNTSSYKLQGNLLAVKQFESIETYSQGDRIKSINLPEKLSITIKPLITIRKFHYRIFYSIFLIIIILRFNPSFAFAIFVLLLLFTMTGQMDKWIDSLIEISINGEDDTFAIERKIFGVKLPSQKFPVSYIHKVSFTPEVDDKINIKLADAQLKYVQYSFGGTLNKGELIWLAQEIRDWLKFQK